MTAPAPRFGRRHRSAIRKLYEKSIRKIDPEWLLKATCMGYVEGLHYGSGRYQMLITPSKASGPQAALFCRGVENAGLACRR